MQVPPQIAFHRFPHVDWAEEEIRARLDNLDSMFGGIVSARVTVDQRATNVEGTIPPVVRIELSVPRGAPVVVAHEPDRLQRKFQKPDLRNAIHVAFDLAEKSILALKEKRAGRPEASDHEDAYQFLGQVAELRPEEDHGFLVNKDGGLLYFHRNSVLNGEFAALRRGDEVHYVEEIGDTGPLAKKVRKAK